MLLIVYFDSKPRSSNLSLRGSVLGISSASLMGSFSSTTSKAAIYAIVPKKSAALIGNITSQSVSIMKSCYALISAQSWFIAADRMKFRARLISEAVFIAAATAPSASVATWSPLFGGSYLGMTCSNFNYSSSLLPSLGSWIKGKPALDRNTSRS